MNGKTTNYLEIPYNIRISSHNKMTLQIISFVGTDTICSNPHYFEDIHFEDFKSVSSLPLPQWYLDKELLRKNLMASFDYHSRKLFSSPPLPPPTTLLTTPAYHFCQWLHSGTFSSLMGFGSDARGIISASTWHFFIIITKSRTI